jgi:hypothetical protein
MSSTSIPPQPVKLSKEEGHERKDREQEEAGIKAPIRKEKEAIMT